MQDKRKLYFIIGIGRSGTTLLASLLNNHPSVLALPEANFPIFFLYNYGKRKNFSTKELDLLFEQIELYALAHPWVGWEFDVAAVKTKLANKIKKGEIENYADLCKEIYSNFSVTGKDKQAASLLIDKNPSSTLFLETIDKTFAEAKYIYLVRDYRANVLSRKQKKYLKSPNVMFNAFRWLWFNKRAYKFACSHPEQVITMRYEDLVSSTESELKRLCRFLEIDEDRDLNTLSGQYSKWKETPIEAEPLKSYAGQKFKDLLSPVNETRVGAWRAQLNPKEIRLCDLICSDFGSKFGYKAEDQMDHFKSLLFKFGLTFLGVPVYFYLHKEAWVNRLGAALKIKRLRAIYKKHGFDTGK